jgi:hypothetical protein
VPDLCGELHDGWLERVVVWNLNVDMISSTVVGSIGRAAKDALEMCQVIESIGAGLGLVQRLERDARVRVFLDILDLLCQAAVPVRRHGCGYGRVGTEREWFDRNRECIVRVRSRVKDGFERVYRQGWDECRGSESGRHGEAVVQMCCKSVCILDRGRGRECSKSELVVLEMVTAD